MAVLYGDLSALNRTSRYGRNSFAAPNSGSATAVTVWVPCPLRVGHATLPWPDWPGARVTDVLVAVYPPEVVNRTTSPVAVLCPVLRTVAVSVEFPARPTCGLTAATWRS